jgi:hypothetical protein
MFAIVRSRRDPNKIENIRSDPDMFDTRFSQEEAYRKGISSLYPSPLLPSSPPHHPPPFIDADQGQMPRPEQWGKGRGMGGHTVKKDFTIALEVDGQQRRGAFTYGAKQCVYCLHREEIVREEQLWPL